METQFDHVRQLIKAKQYAEARRILKTINDPQAKSWLETLDALAPPKSDASAMVSKSQGSVSTGSSGDASDLMKAQFIRVNQLIKRRQYDEARRLLQKIDHPKAQEWLSRLDSLVTSPSDELPKAEPPPVAPSQTFKTRKPLPDIDPKPVSKPQSKERVWMIGILGAGLVFILMLAYFLTQANGSGKPISTMSVVAFVLVGILFVVVIGLRPLLRGSFLGSRLGMRLLIFGGAALIWALTTFVNSQIRVPFQDQALSLQYPATWTAQSLADDEDCQNDPEGRRCMLVLNSTIGSRVWMILKEDTFDFDTTLTDEDDYNWSWLLENAGAVLDKQWETTIDSLPANIRQYTYVDDVDDSQWYMVRFFILRDSHHLIRMSFIAQKPETIASAWSDIEAIYQSIKFVKV